jgi:hypothetical protein
MKKKKFEVVVQYATYHTFFVNAESEEEAQDFVFSGDASVDDIEEEMISSEIREVKGNHRKDK